MSEFQPYPDNVAPTLTELAEISNEEWDKRFPASALRRIKPEMLRRNARANLECATYAYRRIFLRRDAPTTMTAKVIIFDFDGTIADTLDAIVKISNCLAADFGYKQTSLAEINYLKNLSSREIIKQSGISIFKVPFLVRKVKSELTKEIQYLKPIPCIKEALIEIKEQGEQLFIITSNSKENFILFLEKNNMQDLFDFIYSGATLFGKSKIINNILQQQNINYKQVIYVGDETRDIEAAKKSNIKAIAVSWGFNSQEVLAAQNPDFLIHQPHQLINVIASSPLT